MLKRGRYFLCVVCSREEYASPSRIKKRFCSVKCHNIFQTGKKLPKEVVEKMKGKVTWMKGKKHTEEAREKISSSLRGKFGSLSRNWRGGKTEEAQRIRNSEEYKQWRFAVFVRDKFTCQLCKVKASGNLEADHIKQFAWFPELRLDISNGRTLCINCHKKVKIFMGNQYFRVRPKQQFNKSE